MTKFLNISTDDTLGGVSPSDEIVVSQKAIKTYVDNQGGGGGSGYHPDIFDWKWSDYEISDMQWLRADTFSWQDGTVYEAAFQHLQDDMNSIEPHGVHPCFYATAADQTAHTNQFMYYTAGYVAGAAHPYCYVTWDSPNVQIVYADVIAGVGDAGSTLYNGSGVSATSVGTIYSAGTTISGRICEFLVETVAGTNIVYYVAQDGHKFCRPSQENNIETIYAATGVAWYYIYDYDNTRFKLPRTKFGFTGLRDTVGNYVAPGIPNLTGEFYNKYNNVNVLFGPQTTTSGVFKFRATGSSQVLTNSSSALSGAGVMGIDASQASSVYNDSTTVQPPATQMYLYFYVGEFTQTAIQNTAGLNAELFNDKADVDLSNVSQTGKSTAVGWCMPDYSTGVTATQGTEYTATENCYLYARVFCNASGSGQHIEKQIIINSIVVAQPRAFAYCADSIMMPCAKGSTYKFENVNTGSGSYDFIVYRCIGG